MSQMFKLAVPAIIIAAVIYRMAAIAPCLRQSWELFCTMFMQNQFLQGMLVPGFLSVISYGLWKLYLQVDTYLRTNLLRSVTIKKQDDNYDTVVTYISKKYAVKSQSYVAETYKKKRKTWKEWREEFMTGKSLKPRFSFRPSDNSGALSFFKYKGHRIMMVRTKGTTVTVGHDRQPLALEELTLTCWGRDSSVLIDILNEALEDQEQEESDELNIWVLAENSWLGGWEKALSKRPRAKESVILDHDLADYLIDDARKFQQSVQWYSERGIPYRRGYILYGPPGTGKTSFCQVLAGELRLDMCMLTLADGNMSDSKLASVLREAPKKSIIMIEDVDSIFVERKSSNNNGGDGVTFSGFLNAIDGIASQEGRILIMTTNHLDRLDPALIRPGRCDVKAELTHASKGQALQLFTRFFPDTPSELASQFMAKVPDYEVSMAALQGHLLQHRERPESAIENIHEILKPRYQTSSHDNMSVFDHLRRVGLEKYAFAFEAYGYFTKEDISNIGIELIKSWILDLKYDQKAANRFESLISKNAELMKDYVLCDIPVIKELFSRYSCHVSDEMERKSLLEQLCHILVPNGKGLASVWQLKWHMRVYSYSIAAMVEKAYLMVETREDMVTKRVVVNDIPSIKSESVEEVKLDVASIQTPSEWMTTYEWCQRLGNEEFANCALSLETKGYKLAREFQHMTDAKELTEIGFGPKHAKVAKVLIEYKTENGQLHLIESFKLMDFLHVKKEFSNHFPASPEALAIEFAHLATDRLGLGLVSLGACNAHFEKCQEEPTKALNTVLQRLIFPCRYQLEQALVVPERKDWVVGWLKEHSMGQYVNNFINQEILTSDDILKPKPISEEQLNETIGVKKLGHRKKFMIMIADLEQEITSAPTN